MGMFNDVLLLRAQAHEAKRGYDRVVVLTRITSDVFRLVEEFVAAARQLPADMSNDPDVRVSRLVVCDDSDWLVMSQSYESLFPQAAVVVDEGYHFFRRLDIADCVWFRPASEIWLMTACGYVWWRIIDDEGQVFETCCFSPSELLRFIPVVRIVTGT